MTFVFVLLYYRMSGFIAIIGLLVNGVILFGVMAMFGFTFSLPGIAGMVLTIGMAVDANVLIYERLREEIAAGKSLKNAIDASYEKAFTAIFDSNLTSLITAVILFWLGSGTIKGFAVTLTIGLLASMFSAILVTRVLFRWGIDFGLFKKLTFLNLIKSAQLRLHGQAPHRASGWPSPRSWSPSAAFAVRGERALGIDFTGGTRIQFLLGKETNVPLEDVQKVARRHEALQGRLSPAGKQPHHRHAAHHPLRHQGRERHRRETPRNHPRARREKGRIPQDYQDRCQPGGSFRRHRWHLPHPVHHRHRPRALGHRALHDRAL